MSRKFSYQSMQMTETDVPNVGHRIAAACFVTLPTAAMLTAALWALSGTATTAPLYAMAGVLIYLGLLPFSLTIQSERVNPLAERMKLGRFGVFAASFIALLLCGPTQIFSAIPFSVNLTVLQTAALVTGAAWTTWVCIQSAHVSRVTKGQL